MVSRAAAYPTAARSADPTGTALAVATICTDGFSNHHHDPAFRLVPQTGFTNVEFNLWYPDLLTPRYIDSLAERCAASDLRPVSLQGSSFGGEGRNAVIHDVAHKLWFMEQARRLGCRRVKFTGAPRDTHGGIEHVIKVCRELAPAAEAMDVLLLLENHARNVLERPEDYAEIFAAIDSSHVGMCLDTCHFEGAGITLTSVVAQFRDRIQHVDLKDCAAFGKGHQTVVFGEGVTDFDPFLRDLIDGGYTGYLVVEMAWNQPRAPIAANLSAAREMFTPYVRD